RQRGAITRGQGAIATAPRKQQVGEAGAVSELYNLAISAANRTKTVRIYITLAGETHRELSSIACGPHACRSELSRYSRDLASLELAEDRRRLRADASRMYAVASVGSGRYRSQPAWRKA